MTVYCVNVIATEGVVLFGSHPSGSNHQMFKHEEQNKMAGRKSTESLFTFEDTHNTATEMIP